ncbi:MAG: hypothetical protein EHM42_03905 [Planctomycetaceae bacterium]|nr:MAG: hypothetical protein EHM42_03905 [Planctomycetaceae bacterium]
MGPDSSPTGIRAKSPKPLPSAHAHNDYYHQRPLLDALDRGFCSVEADVFLQDGNLVVAHSAFEIRPERTLKALYLQPLRERIEAGGGAVYPDETPLWLLVDIKTNGEQAYLALDKLLAEYSDIVSVTRDGQFEQRPVTVVISGDRPVETIRAQSTRYAGIDGRPGDLDSDEPAEQMPWISSDWKSHFQWRGKGPMPADERQTLNDLVERSHQKKRRLRFWGTPDNPVVWQELRRAGVDLIGADNLNALQEFLRH